MAGKTCQEVEEVKASQAESTKDKETRGVKSL